MKPATFWLLLVVVIILAYALYQFRGPTTDLNVEPHAAGEIEKAKRQ